MPVAVNCCVNPKATDGLTGVTDIDDKAYPRPLSVRVWGIEVLSLIVNESALVPVAAGANFTVAAQMSPFLRVDGQFHAKGNSTPGPVILIFRMVLPLLFVIVTV